MKKTETSIFTWSIYLLVLGFSFITLPKPVVALFGYILEEDLWARMLGIVLTVLGFYYFLIAYYKIHDLYKWKFAGHIFGLICMICFLLLGIADERLAGTMAIELAAAAWTGIVWKNESSQTKGQADF